MGGDSRARAREHAGNGWSQARCPRRILYVKCIMKIRSQSDQTAHLIALDSDTAALNAARACRTGVVSHLPRAAQVQRQTSGGGASSSGRGWRPSTG